MKYFFFIAYVLCSQTFAQTKLKFYNISSGNPDTALAVYLWYYSTPPIDFSKNREEFIRWELEHNKIDQLICDLFSNEKDFMNKKQRLEAERYRFTVYSRERVKNALRDYNSIIDEMEFDFLVRKTDSFLIPIISRAQKCKEVSANEKRALSKIRNGLSK